MARSWALIERELRRFSKSPMLIVMSMVFPLLQLIVLGYAFGGNVKHLVLAVVDQDHGLQAVRVRELAGAVSSGAHTLDLVTFADPGTALSESRSGRVNGVLTIPPDFSRRVLAHNNPRVALISDNTDNFVSASLAATVSGIVGGVNAELISLMFLLMVRVSDPLMPRALFGVLNTVLYFPSGAVYPQQGFPGWMQAIAAVDPFTYAVHAFKSLLLKNTGFDAIAGDLMFLLVFSALTMTAATALFKRTL